jgi:hypothetical protein
MNYLYITLNWIFEMLRDDITSPKSTSGGNRLDLLIRVSRYGHGLSQLGWDYHLSLKSFDAIMLIM